MTQLPITEADLQAYVDGQLSEPRRGEVAAYLAARPDEAAKVAAYRQMNQELRALFDPVLQEDLPERLRAVLPPPAGWWARLRARAGLGAGRAAPGPGRVLAPVFPGRVFMPYAATLLWLGLGVALGWQLKAQVPPGAMPPMVKHAAVAYATYAGEVRHPVEVGAGQEAHLVAWLSKRLGMPLKAARLDGAGFHLMGGRLLAGTQGPVAQFMYDDAAGQRLTLYIKTQERGRDQSTAFRFTREDGVASFYWIDAGTGYVLSGNLERAELLRLAELVYGQLNAPEPARGGGNPAAAGPAT